MRKNKTGFTLIELVAVLVIMAIIALIVTPLVMNIIKRARISADKRSIDAYGRSIELAIASYLLDTGTFPTQVSQLTVEYSGDEVVCETTQLNDDSSVYLTGCTVGGRTVEYAYGDKGSTPSSTYEAYSVGDHISYNNVTYFVIEDSGENSDTVKLLKDDALTYTEVNNLELAGITVSEYNGYGKVQFGSSVDYSTSLVKQVVDAWKSTAVVTGDSATARLITHDDLIDNLGYINSLDTTETIASSDGTTPTWVYNSNYYYWTMSQYGDSSLVWNVDSQGTLFNNVPTSSAVVRPVLELNKSAVITLLNS